ncbi:MAG: hypothetical protein JXB38_20140 [Anaerolineales bacterium]|nr:hypothetical protein [Anaerolineales bacterium]
MKTFTHRFRVNAPLEHIAAFHSDSRALKMLTPPPIFVAFHHLEPLGEGSLADFTMWFGPIPIHWRAVHSEVDPQHGFIDTQESGPFAFWQHRHTFTPIDENTTLVEDTIQAQPSNHVFYGLVSRLMWLTLPLLFAYRAWRTRQEIAR